MNSQKTEKHLGKLRWSAVDDKVGTKEFNVQTTPTSCESFNELYDVQRKLLCLKKKSK